MSQEHFVEFAFGLANSKQNFLWIVRPNLVTGGQNLLLPEEFLAEIKDRGKIVSWCNQKEIINHPSIGGFLTHSGWNSVIESLAAGVPMICWPFTFDQPTNCFCLCNNWGVGIELEKDVKRSEVERVVRELMIGEKGKELKKNALEWKKKAEAATGLGGSSYLNLDRLVEEGFYDYVRVAIGNLCIFHYAINLVASIGNVIEEVPVPDVLTRQHEHRDTCLKRHPRSASIISNELYVQEGMALSSMIDKIYPIGPLDYFSKKYQTTRKMMGSNPIYEKKDDDDNCIEWLNSKDEKSVICINYSTTTSTSQEHFLEFAFGLANSKQNFLWNMRPNLVTRGQNLLLPEEFLAEIKDRGKIASWCNQKEIIHIIR
ncbi:hypothetical protein M9H77_19719 [Catharanthus roseus]|uniref:Uncharacterized protein n=1 Tax=Catharanthus roseus TaxID=4058 RepID=A0ACC0BB47_CATRO|nr:hypothetical protein M9H77_19719 [Catharanthus roseus]